MDKRLLDRYKARLEERQDVLDAREKHLKEREAHAARMLEALSKPRKEKFHFSEFFLGVLATVFLITLIVVLSI